MIQVSVITPTKGTPQVQIVNEGGWNGKSASLPLLACRICAECGAPVVLYAKGRFPFKDSKGKPVISTHKATGWNLVETESGFVLAAMRGHDFDHAGDAKCHHAVLIETVAGVFVDGALVTPCI